MMAVGSLRPGAIFRQDGELYRVLEYKHQKIARGGGTIILKVQNLQKGAVLRKTFPSGGKVERVALTNLAAQYLYRQRDDYFFMDKRTYEQFALSRSRLGALASFLKEGLTVTVQLYEGKVLAVELPLKVEYLVTDAPPDIRGDTAQGGTKEVLLENGLKVRTPMFIKKNDRIRVDTRTGAYVERA